MLKTLPMIVTLAFVAACGPPVTPINVISAEPEPPAEQSIIDSRPPAMPLGTSLKVQNNIYGQTSAYTVTVSDLVAATTRYSEFLPPDNGEYVSVKVEITCDAGKYNVNPLAFQLVTADGIAHEVTYSAIEDELDAAELTTGEKTVGRVAFDIPPGDEKGATVALKNFFASADSGAWRLTPLP